MTNIMEKRLELITEEVEQMQRSKLFTLEETRTILTKRKEFERQLLAPTRDVKSYTDYISYEKNLLKDIGRRRVKCKTDAKIGRVEHRIIKRVKVLYDVVLKLYDDSSVLLPFLAFCKKVNYTNAAADAVENMMTKHSDDPLVCYAAAKWHAYDREDTETAMILLLQAVSRHKDNQLLYKGMMEIELFENDKIVLTKENSSQLEICAKKFEKILNKAFLNIHDFDFYIEILELLETYPFTTQMQEIITEHLIKHFSDNEKLWHLLAQRERKDPKTSMQTESNENAESATPKKTPKAKLEACFAKYRQGLAVVSPSTKPKLWALYIDFLLQLQQEPPGAGTVLKLETLKTALKEASEEDYVTEKQYMAWLRVVDHEEALQVAEKATRSIPYSVDLWKSRLRLQMIEDTDTEVNRVFKMGLNALQEKALPLWLSIIRYHLVTSDDDYIELIYKDGVKQPEEVSNVLKPKYIEWLAVTKGIDAAREAYAALAEEKPYCKELHRVMSKLELIDMENFDAWGQVHKLACEQFGKTDVDVWINHIQFYLRYNNEIPDLNERVEEICKQALESMPQELVYLFERKYNHVKKIIADLEKQE